MEWIYRSMPHVHFVRIRALPCFATLPAVGLMWHLDSISIAIEACEAPAPQTFHSDRGNVTVVLYFICFIMAGMLFRSRGLRPR